MAAVRVGFLTSGRRKSQEASTKRLLGVVVYAYYKNFNLSFLNSLVDCFIT